MTGPAQFGYGDGDEATIISFGDDPSQKHVTTYFRKTFEVASPQRITGLKLELLRDDGAAVYINGTRVVSSNLAANATHSQFADSVVTGDDESRFFSFDVNPSVLVAGTNLIAVEVHQASATSPDLSFDLRLTATSSSQLIGDVLANDNDVDGDSLSAAVTDPPDHGILTLRADGTFIYTPEANFAGVDTFTYRASDGARTSDPATVTLTIEPPVSTPCTVADLNADGQVTLADLARLVENYGASPEPFEDGDLDGDGYVGVADLPLLRNLLGQSCARAPPPPLLFIRR